jgi:hypothetical protein
MLLLSLLLLLLQMWGAERHLTHPQQFITHSNKAASHLALNQHAAALQVSCSQHEHHVWLIQPMHAPTPTYINNTR